MKDPDITAPYLFLFGKTIPEKWGRLKLGFMPYRIQHYYFFFSKFVATVIVLYDNVIHL